MTSELINLDGLSEEEKATILKVIKRDEDLRWEKSQQVNQLKNDIHNLRIQSVLREGDDLNKICARCHVQFGYFFNTGEVCSQCKFRVCKTCRNVTLSGSWLCTLCFKQSQLKLLTGEWMKPKDDKKFEHGADIVKASIRKSIMHDGQIQPEEEYTQAHYGSTDGISTEEEDSRENLDKSYDTGSFLGESDTSNSSAQGGGNRNDIDRAGYPRDSDTKRLDQLFESFRSNTADIEKKNFSVTHISCRRKRDSGSSSSSDDDEGGKEAKTNSVPRGQSVCDSITSSEPALTPSPSKPSSETESALNSPVLKTKDANSVPKIFNGSPAKGREKKSTDSLSSDNAQQHGKWKSKADAANCKTSPSASLSASTSPRRNIGLSPEHANFHSRKSSGQSDTSSMSSARTASPGTKMRLLDLASSRAYDRDSSDGEHSRHSQEGSDNEEHTGRYQKKRNKHSSIADESRRSETEGVGGGKRGLGGDYFSNHEDTWLSSMSDSSDSTISVTNLSLTDLHSESLEACSRGLPPLVASSSVDEGVAQASRDSSLVSSAYTSFSSAHEVHVTPHSVSAHDLYVSPISNADAQSPTDACLTSSALQQLADSLAGFTDTDSHDDTCTNTSVTSPSLSSNNSLFHTPDESRREESVSSFDDPAPNVRKDSYSFDDKERQQDSLLSIDDPAPNVHSYESKDSYVPDKKDRQTGTQNLEPCEVYLGQTNTEKDKHTPKQKSSNSSSANKTFTVEKEKQNLPKRSESEKESDCFEKHLDLELEKSLRESSMVSETNQETSTPPSQSSPRYQKRVNSKGKKSKRFTSDLKEDSSKPKDEKHHSHLSEHDKDSVVEDESKTQKHEFAESSSTSKCPNTDENFNAPGTLIYEKPDYILTEMKKGHYFEPTSNPTSDHIKHGFNISGNQILHSLYAKDQQSTMMNFHKLENDNISDNLSVISEHSEPEDDGNLNDLASNLCPDEDENIDDIANLSLDILNEVEKPVIKKSPRLERKIKKVKEREAMKKTEKLQSNLTVPGLEAVDSDTYKTKTDKTISEDVTNVDYVLKVVNIEKDSSDILQAHDKDILMKTSFKSEANRSDSPLKTMLPTSPCSGRNLQSVLAVNSENLKKLSEDIACDLTENQTLHKPESLNMDAICTLNKTNELIKQTHSLVTCKEHEQSMLSESVQKTPIPPKRTKNKAVKSVKEPSETEIKVTSISSKSDNGSNSPRIVGMTDDCDESSNHIKAPVKPPRSFIVETTPCADYNRTNEEVMARNTTDKNTFVEERPEIKAAFSWNSPSINASVESGLSDTAECKNKKPSSEVSVLSDREGERSRSVVIKSDSSDSNDKRGAFRPGNGKSGYSRRKYFADISMSFPEQQSESTYSMIDRSQDSGRKKKKFFPDIPLLEEDDDVVESVISSRKRDSGCVLDADVELSRNSLYLSQNKLHSQESAMHTNETYDIQSINKSAEEGFESIEQEQTVLVDSNDCEKVVSIPPIPSETSVETNTLTVKDGSNIEECMETSLSKTNTLFVYTKSDKDGSNIEESIETTLSKTKTSCVPIKPDKDGSNVEESIETTISKTNTSFVHTNVQQSHTIEHLQNVCSKDLGTSVTKSPQLSDVTTDITNSDHSMIGTDTSVEGTNFRGCTSVEGTNMEGIDNFGTSYDGTDGNKTSAANNSEGINTHGTSYDGTDGNKTSATSNSKLTNTGDQATFLTNQVEEESVNKSKTATLSSLPSLSSETPEETSESSDGKNKPQDEVDGDLARMLMPPPSIVPKASPSLTTTALPSVILSKSDSPCMHTTDSSKLSVNNEGLSDDGGSHGNSSENTPEHRASRQGRLSVPSLVLTADDNGDEDEDNIDDLVASHRSVASSKSGRGPLSLFSDSRESILSIYSDAGEINYGKIPVSGEVLLGVDYNYKTGALEIYVKQCKDLAPVDTKKNRSDPYVKTYLLPDKTRSGKRKTKIKKHTLNPTFDEVLRYTLSQSEVENRILWLTVWHSDRFGRNDFLGEVMLSLDCYKFGDATPKWYPLQERLEEPQIGSLMPYKGDLILSIKFITPEQLEKESSKKLKTKKNKHKKGAIHVMVKEARNLTAVRANGSSDPFCKGYLLPDKSKSSKQKTPVIKKNCNPAWNHLFTFDEVNLDELPDRSLEITIWDHDTLSSNDFLGGIRFNIGTGVCEGKSVDWMDGRGEEIAIWQCMIDRPNTWIDACVNLRASMGKSGIKK